MGINFSTDYKPREAIKIIDRGFHCYAETSDPKAGTIRKYAGGDWTDPENTEKIRADLEAGRVVMCINDDTGEIRQILKADLWLRDQVYARHEKDMAEWEALEASLRGQTVDDVLKEVEAKVARPQRSVARARD